MGKYIKYFIFLLCISWLAYTLYLQFSTKNITIEAGPKGGFFDTASITIKNRLKEKNINLNIVHREDTINIIEDVKDPKSKIDLGFVAQDLKGVNYKNINALGSLILQPLFIFHRKDLNIKSLADLKGLNVAVGPVNSGTRVLAEKILDNYAVNESNTVFLPYSHSVNFDMMKKKTADVGFFLLPANNKFVFELAKNSELKIFSLNESNTLARMSDNLYVVNIYAGSFDIKNQVPANDIKAVAVPVTLIAKKSLDKSVVVAISQIVKEEFRNANIVSDAATFPTMEFVKSLEINNDAETIFKLPFGSDLFLYKILDFRIASLIDNFSLFFGYLVSLYFILYYLGFPKVYEAVQKLSSNIKFKTLLKFLDKSKKNKLTSKELQKLKKIENYFKKTTDRANTIIPKIKINLSKFKN